jgi:hypothetical protein
MHSLLVETFRQEWPGDWRNGKANKEVWLRGSLPGLIRALLLLFREVVRTYIIEQLF